MKYLILLLLLLLFVRGTYGQSHRKDSLLNLLSTAKQDTLQVNLLAELGSFYENNSIPDSTLLTYYKGLELAKSISYKDGEMNLQGLLGFYSWRLGDYSTSIKLGYQLLESARLEKDTATQVNAYAILFNSYRDLGDHKEALRLIFESIRFSRRLEAEDCPLCGVSTASIGSIYYGMEKYDSALFYLQKSLTYPKDFSYGWILLMTGRTLVKMNSEDVALEYFYQSIHHLPKEENYKDLAGAYTGLANLFSKMDQPDSAIYYGKLALNLAMDKGFSRELIEAYLSLSATYESINLEYAFDYYKHAMDLKNKIYDQGKQIQIANYRFNEELRLKEIQASEADFRNRSRMNAMLGSTFILLIIAFFLYRNNRAKHRAKIQIEGAYNQLKSTQAQLIQSEKMASLGELTAGIAHEIQNPLNFVNNFSELSTDLIEEMREELAAGNGQAAEEIAEDLKANLSKINHHGKRADAIVKSMLEHSKTGTGQKELTDINKLVSEITQLAYRNHQAKDQSIEVNLNFILDPGLAQVEVIPSDLGKVILNLVNNALYACSEKATLRQAQGDVGYKPKVIVSTTKTKNGVEISVSDNGSGIPESIKDKIFQPFFTTKPTGSGTGLGLSLSYDIVKAHGGELKIESSSTEGTTFKIKLVQ